MEENQTQELRRFGKFSYVLGARKRDFFIDSIINTIASLTYEENSFLYLYPRNPRRIRFLIGLVFNSEHFPNSAQIRLSVDRSVDRPKSRFTVPVGRAQPRVRPYQSVDRCLLLLFLLCLGFLVSTFSTSSLFLQTHFSFGCLIIHFDCQIEKKYKNANFLIVGSFHVFVIHVVDFLAFI